MNEQNLTVNEESNFTFAKQKLHKYPKRRKTIKTCVIQPRYSFDERDAEKFFEGLVGLLDECDESLDIIVLPEYSDALVDVKGRDGFYGAVKKYNSAFLEKAPENSMPAFGAAVALGAEEIEFDLWSTTDGVLVSCHDSTLDRVSDGHGKIYEHTYAELLELDFGVKHGERFRGLKIPTFEEILQKFAGRVIMNIHVKIWDANFENPMIEEIVALVRKYDCEKHIYFMTSSDRVIKRVMEYAPELRVCVGWDGNKDPASMVERAIELGAYKVQLFKPYFNEETVKRAHEHGILCNVFWADAPEEAKRYFEMGIDTVLTNDYLTVYNAVKGYLNTGNARALGRKGDTL